MKKTIFVCFFALSLLLSSCDGMDAVYKDFRGDEPVIYTEKVEGVVAYPGNCRLKLIWNEMVDSRVKGATVYWNNRTGHKDFTIDPHQKTEIIVEDMPEGSMIIEIVTWDENGHTSVPQTISASTYGSKFISSIADKSRIVSVARGASNDVYVKLFHSPSSCYQYMEVEYNDLSGNKKTLQVAPGTESLLLSDCGGNDITCRSVFLPEAACIDLLYSEDVKTPEIPDPVITVGVENANLAFPRGSDGSTRCISTWSSTIVEISDDAKDWLTASLAGNVLSYKAIARNPNPETRTGKIILKSDAVTKEIAVTQQGQCAKYGTAYGNEGIIFWQNPDNPKEYKIISAKGWSAMKWSSANSTTGATSYTGVTGSKKNIDMIREMADYGKTNTYAMESIEGLGEGWYMPSVNELKDEFWPTFNGTTFDASTKSHYNDATADEKACRDKFEAAMAAIGGQKINMGTATGVGSSIMTCTEVDNANQVGFRISNSAITTTTKTKAEYYARGVKVVIIED